MQITVQIKISPMLQQLLDRFGNGEELRLAGGMEAYNFLRKYHADFATKWRGSRWIPGPNSGEFAQNVINGWQLPVVSSDRVKITNTFGLLSWKVSGGTITPKTAGALAIPLIGSAKGVPPRGYPAGLFVAGSALCQQLGAQVSAVYALKKSVTQAPWPGAMPPDEDIQEAFRDGALDKLSALAMAA